MARFSAMLAPRRRAARAQPGQTFVALPCARIFLLAFGAITLVTASCTWGSVASIVAFPCHIAPVELVIVVERWLMSTKACDGGIFPYLIEPSAAGFSPSVGMTL